MRLVKTRPKYRCDFCRHTSTEEAMRRHESICWGNPDRVCPSCGGTGLVRNDYCDGLYEDFPCYWCARRDPDRLPPATRNQHAVPARLVPGEPHTQKDART